MRKLVNDPFAVVDEMVEGIARAFPTQIEVTASGRGIIATRRAEERRVGIVFGGGSGHEPAFFGYVGPGLADGAALGNVFASPSARPIVEVAERVTGEPGRPLPLRELPGRRDELRAGDELLAERGIPTLQTAVTDDVASAPASGREPDRRGVAGDVFVLKAAGARADEGGACEEVDRPRCTRTHARGQPASGLAPCTVPAAEAADVRDARGRDGHRHGRPRRGRAPPRRPGLRRRGRRRCSLDLVLDDLPLERRRAGLGARQHTRSPPVMEAYIVLRGVTALLGRARRLPRDRALVGEYITSLEMAGLSRDARLPGRGADPAARSAGARPRHPAPHGCRGERHEHRRRRRVPRPRARPDRTVPAGARPARRRRRRRRPRGDDGAGLACRVGRSRAIPAGVAGCRAQAGRRELRLGRRERPGRSGERLCSAPGAPSATRPRSTRRTPRARPPPRSPAWSSVGAARKA